MRAWIFQANPNRYDIHKSLKVEHQEYWNLRQHAKKVHVGDRVLIWICGKEAGIYAVGTVLTEPIIQPDSPVGMLYWIEKREGARPIARVLVRYDKVLSEPLAKVFLQCDSSLWGLKILSSPRGTNFEVTESEWNAFSSWLAYPQANSPSAPCCPP